MKNTIISCFRNIEGKKPQNITLWSWLNSTKYKDKVLTAWALSKEERDKIKFSLPCITPSGLFSGRSLSTLVKHSGFISFDIDAKDNEFLDMFETKQKIIQNIPQISYCGYSFSGSGLWGLIRIADPAKHKEHYNSIVKAFDALNIKVDTSGCDITRLRVYSFDPEPYINLAAPMWVDYIESPKPKPLILKPEPKNKRFDDFSRIVQCVKKIQALGVDITGTMPTWFAIGCGIASVLNESGRDYFHAISQYYPKYTSKETDEVYSRCIKYSGDVKRFFYHCKTHGINFMEP